MIRILLLFIGLSAFTYAIPPETSMVTDVMETIKNKMKFWQIFFLPTAYFLFATFAVIELVLVFGQKALKRELEFSAIFSELIRLILIFGLFNMLILNPHFLLIIIDGFEWISTKAGGLNLDVAFMRIVNSLIGIWGKMSILSPGEAILLALILISSALVFFKLLGTMIKNYLFAFASVYISSIFFAMGTFAPTRQWGINGLNQVIKYSAKYMLLLLVIGLGISVLGDALTQTETIKDLVIILFAVIVMHELANGAESIIDGIFTGMGGSGGSSSAGILKTAGAAAVGAAVGAAGGGAMGAAAGAKGGYGAVQSAAAAGGDNATSSSGGGGNFMKSAGAAAAGAVGGAMTGGVKGAMGKANSETGAGTGAGIAKAAGAVGNFMSSSSSSPAGGDTADNSGGASNTKDRNGFDMSQLEGSISPDTSKTNNKGK